MLCTIGTADILGSVCVAVPLLTQLDVLDAFEAGGNQSHKAGTLGGQNGLPVEENSTQALFEILLQASHGLLKDIHAGRAFLTISTFICKIVIQDLLNGVCVRQWNKLLVLGDVLPVINQEGFQVVWHDQFDGWARMESILL